MAFPVPATVIRYLDPLEGFRGWLVFSGDRYPLAAGGCRVQRGLREETVIGLAEAMTLKQRLLGLAVDGAKAGIDYNPDAPGKREALRRFLRFLRPYLLHRFSMGPDMGTSWGEIEGIAREEGIPSVKIAIARAQRLEEGDFFRRLRLLEAEVDGMTIAQRRAGHALAHAALVASKAAGASGEAPRAGVQGFGTLGRGAVSSLAAAGVPITAVADESGCVVCERGVDVAALLAMPHRQPIVSQFRVTGAAPEVLFRTPLDVVVLAACEDAMTVEQASRLEASAVVVGANLGLAPSVETVLHRLGIAVVPDLVGGCGGSASMDAIFGAPTCPTPMQVLCETGARLRDLVERVLADSRLTGVTPRDAARALCDVEIPHSRRPYGHWAVSTRRPIHADWQKEYR